MSFNQNNLPNLPSKAPNFCFETLNHHDDLIPCPDLPPDSHIYQQPFQNLKILPRCLLKFIMSYLTKPDLLALRAVCQRFNNCVFECKAFEHVELTRFSSEYNLLEFIQNVPYRNYVKSIVLPKFKFAPQALSAVLEMFSSLEQVQCEQQNFGDSQMVAFNTQTAANIKSLILNSTQVTDCGLSVVSCWRQFRNLEKLVICNHRYSGMSADGIIPILTNNPGLKSFVIANCFLDCSKLIPTIAAHLPQLEYLCLCGITNIQPQHLPVILENCPNLRKLSVKVGEDEQFSNEGTVTIRHPKLESLGLSCLRNVFRLQLDCPQLRELYFVHVTLINTFVINAPRLESLELCLTNFGMPPEQLYPSQCSNRALCPLNTLLDQLPSIRKLKMIMCRLVPQVNIRSYYLERLNMVKCDTVQQLILDTPQLTYFRAEQCLQLLNLDTNNAPLLQQCSVTDKNKILQCVKCMKVVNSCLEKRSNNI